MPGRKKRLWVVIITNTLIRLKLQGKQCVGQSARNVAKKCRELSSEFKQKTDLNYKNPIEMFLNHHFFQFWSYQKLLQAIQKRGEAGNLFHITYAVNPGLKVKGVNGSRQNFIHCLDGVLKLRSTKLDLQHICIIYTFSVL